MKDTKFKKGMTPWNKGKKGLQKAWNKGIPMSEKAKEKLSISKTGSKGYWLGKERPEMRGKRNPNGGKFGNKHPKWTEDKKNPLYKSIRTLYKYKDWRFSIFKRDKFSCVLCEASKCYVEADHYPKRFISIIKENNIKTIDEALECNELCDINNGRTLCKECHLKTDTWGNKKILTQ